MEKNPILYIVVPCYNEIEVLEETTKQYIQLEGNKRDLNSKDKCVLELINFFS